MARERSAAGAQLMGAFFSLSLGLMPGFAWADPVRSQDTAEALVHARLVAEKTSLQRNHSEWLAVQLIIEPGWHIYWRNPGDAGLATGIKWTLPRGVTAGPIVWPRPERFVTHSIVGYGYRAGVVLLAAMKLPGRFPLDAISMEAAVSWLACSEVCVPGATTLKRTLPVSDAAATNDPAQARLFADARRRIPQRAPFETTFVMDDEQIRLRFPRAALSGIKQPSVAFYPFDSALIEHGAPQAMLLDSRRTELILRRSPVANDRIGTLDGLLVIGESVAGTAKSRAFDVFARRTNPAPDPSRAR